MRKNATRKRPGRRESERGSITVFFLLFAIVLTGAISYSLYFAHAANEKIRIENAADAATFAMAGHAAKGLNMIAANNLAIGASLHIAGAMPILSRYIAMVRATMSTCGDVFQNGAVLFGAEAPYQKYFDWFKPVSKAYLRTAAGVTTVNRQIVNFWLAPAALRGVESLRLNAPGAVGLPLQVSQIGLVANGEVLSALFFRYRGLRQTFASEAMCHATASSRVMSGFERNNPIQWAMNPIYSLFETPNFGEAGESLIAMADERRGDIKESMQSAENGWGYACKKRPDGEYVDEYKCEQLKKMRDAYAQATDAEGRSNPFGFGPCGIGAGGDYAEQMRHKFSPEEDSIGFVYPDAGENGDFDAFNDGVSFGTVAGLAFRVKKDSDKQCPAEWKQTIDGKQICQPTALWHYEEQPKKGDEGFNLAVGGMVEMLKDPKSLKSGWSRTKWATSQARAYYYPSSGSDDPGMTKPNTSLFWPAWKAKATPSTIVKELIEVLFGD